MELAQALRLHGLGVTLDARAHPELDDVLRCDHHDLPFVEVFRRAKEALFGSSAQVAVGGEEPALYASEILIEPALWIWQGVISFVCDFVDLGRLSWSHPADRFCACLFISSQVVKFFYFFRACSWPCLLIFPPALGGSLWIFGRSCLACTRRDAASYFFWHSAWHFALPSAGLLYYVLRFTEG